MRPVVNIEKERKAFIEVAKKLGINTAMVETPMGLQFKYGSTNDAFKIWQASAQRQGYKLVPVEASELMLDAGLNCEHEIDNFVVIDEIYKAMIGGC